MHLTTLMTRLPYAVFLSVLLFASHAKKTDNKSTPASNENEEDADLDENALKKWDIMALSHNYDCGLDVQ